MARCDKQDSDSTLSPAKHSSTTEDRHNVSESRTRRQTRRIVLVGYAGRNGRERISFKRKKSSTLLKMVNLDSSLQKTNQATTKEDYRHHRTPQNKQRLCGWNGCFLWITTPAVILLLSLGGEYNRILIHFKLSLRVLSLSLRGNEIKARHGNKNYNTFQVHIFISY